MRAKSAYINLVLIASLLLSSVTANVYADPPADLGPGLLASALPTAGTSTPQATEPAAGAGSTADLPATASLEKVAEFQQLFVDMAKNPFWFAASASIYVGFFVLHKTLSYLFEDIPKVIFVIRALRKTLPADAESTRFFDVLERDLQQYADAASAFAREVKDLERRRRVLMTEIDVHNQSLDRKFRDAVSYARKVLKDLTPLEQMKQISSDDRIRNRMKQSESGRKWLSRFDKHYHAYLDHQDSLQREFGEIHKSISQLSEHINNASMGWVRNESLRHRPLDINLKPVASGDIGTMRHFHDSGFFSDVKDPRDLPAMVNTAVVNCRDQYTKLGQQRDKLRRELVLRGAVKPIALTGAGVLSWLGYRYSSSKIKKQFNAEPAEIVAKQKTDATAQIVKDAVQSTSPIKMQEAIHAWRNNKSNPKAAKLFDVLTTSVKSHLKAMAHDINTLSAGKIDGAAIEERLAQFEKDPGSLEDVVEMALADAASLELKISDPMELEGILLAELKDGPKYLKRDTLLSNQVGLIPKYAWQTLGVTNLPISSTTNSSLLKVMKTEFDRIRDEEAAQAAKDAKDAKAGSPTTAGSPVPADPAAAVLPTSSQAGADAKPAGMEVGGLDGNLFLPSSKVSATSATQSIAVSEPMSPSNATRYAPYVPDPGSVQP